MPKHNMTLAEFEQQVQELRVKKGWKIELECAGVWCATVCDKETGKQLGVTGSTSLEALLHCMIRIPIEEW